MANLFDMCTCKYTVDSNKHNSMKSSDRLTMSTGKQKKRGGIFGMFGSSKVIC